MQVVRSTLSTSFDFREPCKYPFRYISFVTKLRTEMQSLFRQVSPCGAGSPDIVKTATVWPHAPQPLTRARQFASRDCDVGMIALNECLARLCFRGSPGPERDRQIPWHLRPRTLSMAETKSFQLFDRFHGSLVLPVQTSLAVQRQSRMPCSATPVEFGPCSAISAARVRPIRDPAVMRSSMSSRSFPAPALPDTGREMIRNAEACAAGFGVPVFGWIIPNN